MAGGRSSVVKVVGLFRRKKGLSMEQFIDYCENQHLKLFDEHVALPGVIRYARRYLEPFAGLANPMAPKPGEAYDVIMEVWYKREMFDSLRGQSNPDFSEMVKKDEENLFDRESMCMFLSEDCESKNRPWDAK